MTGGSKCGPSSSSVAFVSKISNDGQSLIYSTYLGGGGAGPGTGGSTVSSGGSGNDNGTGIAVDSNDNAWVVGLTNSNNFPVTPDAYSLYCEPASLMFDFGSLQNVGEFSACARSGAVIQLQRDVFLVCSQARSHGAEHFVRHVSGRHAG